MKRQRLVNFAAALLLALSFSAVRAAGSSDQDTDTHLVNAKVVEVTDAHVSVIASTGVEHVIAIDRAGTKVKMNGSEVSLKDLHEGDIVTIDLDEHNPMMFAKNIVVADRAGDQVARVRR